MRSDLGRVEGIPGREPAGRDRPSGRLRHLCRTRLQDPHSDRPDAQNQIIDAITTQETLFFRDESPFDALQHKVLPDLIDRRAGTAYPRRLRVWSAGCSTGQEPYSIAMTLCEAIPRRLPVGRQYPRHRHLQCRHPAGQHGALRQTRNPARNETRTYWLDTSARSRAAGKSRMNCGR